MSQPSEANGFRAEFFVLPPRVAYAHGKENWNKIKTIKNEKLQFFLKFAFIIKRGTV
jgi:hypothetical protein